LASCWLAVSASPMLLGCSPHRTGTSDEIIDIASEPRQETIAKPEVIRFSRRGWDWTITPLAKYALAGVVLGRENYYLGWNASLSPCDVAMAWGELVSDHLDRRIKVWQDNRWYFWRLKSGFGHDNAFVARYSSNTHIVPANDNLARAARSLVAGDVAELSGELVRIDGRQGSSTVYWVSSLSRDDRGDLPAHRMSHEDGFIEFKHLDQPRDIIAGKSSCPCLRR
jgi:hypothetical protein